VEIFPENFWKGGRQLWKESAFHIGQHTSQFVCGGIGFYAVSSPGDDLDVGGCIAFGIVDTVQGG